jgi:DNA-binding transcriptional LysR family regulator
MELYQLEYFLEAARQKHFTRAAARLNLAQAALSEQIRKLEAELGAPLFQRGRRESVLTAAGETLREHAEGLLEGAAAARRAVAEVVGLRGGRLSVGTVPSVGACVLPGVVAAFRARHPRVELVLFEGTSEAVAQWVERGRVEFGLVQMPAPTGSFDAEPIWKEPFVLLVAAGHPLAGRREVSLEECAGEAFLLYKGRVRETALLACRGAGFEPRIVCETSELETLRRLVASGLGCALLPRLAAPPAGGGCAAVALRGAPVEREIAFLTRAGWTESPGAGEARRLVREEARRLSDFWGR